MKVLKRLLSRITLYPTVFLAGFICLLLATIFSELSPFLLQKIIDGPLTALTHGGGQGDMLQMGAFYLLVLSLGQLISYMGNRILLHGSNQVTASLRDKAFQVMQGLPISYFDDKPAGKIATRIVNELLYDFSHLLGAFPLYPRDSLLPESYDGPSLVFGLSDFLWDSVSLQGHDGPAYEGFLRCEKRGQYPGQ